MTFDPTKISQINKFFVIFSITTSMVTNVYLYGLNNHKDAVIKRTVEINSSVFEYIRATSEMNNIVSDNTARINHYTSMHEPEEHGPLKFCPECWDIYRHNTNKRSAADSLPKEPLRPVVGPDAVQFVNLMKKEYGVMNNPQVNATDLQILMSDSIEFAEMIDRNRRLLFTVDVIQKRNLSDCRDMFGTDYLETERN